MDMAEGQDLHFIQKISDFCCPYSYIHFQVFMVRTHIDRAKQRIKLLGLDDKATFQLCRYLRMIRRTLVAIEEEMKLADTHAQPTKASESDLERGTVTEV